MSDEPVLLVREAAEADIPAILAMERRTPQAAHWTPAHYKARFQPNDGLCPVLLLALRAGCRPVGFLAGRIVGPPGAAEMEIENIAVAVEARRSGTGRRLWLAALARARGCGVARILLEVRASNEAAQAFYQSQGCIVSGRRPAYYVDPVEDAVLMERVL